MDENIPQNLSLKGNDKVKNIGKTKRLMSLFLAVIMLLGSVQLSKKLGITMKASAIDSRVERAVQTAVAIANDNSHGYSQSNRWGPDYDCSSLVYYAYSSSGFSLSPRWFNTQNMGGALINAGFIELSNVNLSSSANLQRGDILWKSGHAEIYIGDNKLVGAHEDYGYPQIGDQNGKEISVTNYYYVGNTGTSWTKVYRYIENTAEPKTAHLSINKSDFKIGEEFVMTLSSDTNCQFYLSVFDSDSGNRILGETVLDEYRNAFQKAGHYTAYMSAFNSKGSVDSNWVDFYVFGSAPTYATLSLDKTHLDIGETVVLSTRTDAYYVKIYTSIFKDDTKIYSGDIPYNFKYKPTSSGIYKAYVSAYTYEGGVDSNWITFYVGKYNIIFNLDGGSCLTSSKTVTYGSTYGTLPTPTKSGYTFDGWFTSEIGGKRVTSSTKVDQMSDHVLYAHWTLNHTHSYTSKITTAATCTAPGIKTFTCSCGDKYTEEIPALGHIDENNDNRCDRCAVNTGAPNTPDTPSESCSHICHRGGLIWAVIRFFYKIFRTNKYCSCGAAHY